MGRIKSVVSDWNGTLIKNKDEAPILKGLGMWILKAAANPFHPIRKYPQCRVFHLLKMKQKLELLYDEKRKDKEFDFVSEMYKIFNEDVIKGLPVKYIRRFVDNYAGDPNTQSMLDRNIFYPLTIRRNALDKVGILSTGYDLGIARIIKESIYSKNGLRLDFIISNPLERKNGIAIGFSLANYKKKHEILEKLFREGKLEPDTCAYIGDSLEDEGCMSLVPYPIVSFYAADEFKQYAASKMKAFILEKERDLFELLDKA
jgi:phosphoserine phosphatase